MIRRRHLLILPILTLLLSGCVGALVGSTPAQLYRFGEAAAATAAGPAVPPLCTLVLAAPAFASEVAGPRLLTTQDGEASYIKAARWVAPAPLLFQAALKARLAARAPWIAVVDRRGRGDDPVLQVSVSRFEAAYPGDGRTPPTVLIEGEAVLVAGQTGRQVARYRFAERQPAADNRTGAIVAAFDAATVRVVSGTVDWAAREETALPQTHD